jgi:hypothetical protein
VSVFKKASHVWYPCCCCCWLRTGTTAAFISWALAQQRKNPEEQQQQQDAAAALPPLMLAAYGGSLTMRAAQLLSFHQQGRSMVAEDMIKQLGDPVLLQAGLALDARRDPELERGYYRPPSLL